MTKESAKFRSGRVLERIVEPCLLDEGGKARICSATTKAWRINTTHADGAPIEEREAIWLVLEWRSDEDPTPKFHLTTLPRRMSHKQLVRIIKERWRTERMYEDLKGELGRCSLSQLAIKGETDALLPWFANQSFGA